MIAYNKGWWDCFISFAGSMKGSWIDDTTCSGIMKSAGVTSREIGEVLEEKKKLLNCYPKVREMLEVRQMELYTEEEGGEE